MNTHLHLLEVYTNLYRIWPDATLRQRLKNSIDHLAYMSLNQQRVENIILDVAETVYRKALESGGGGQWLVNEEYVSGDRDPAKVWWVQAEASVGLLTAYQLTKKAYFLNAVQQIWIFIQNECVDKMHGEWFWYAPENGVVDHGYGKVKAWKGPYHNVMACIELLARLEK